MTYNVFSGTLNPTHAEPIVMPFGLWARMDPRNHVLDGVRWGPTTKGAILGKGAPIVKYRDILS